MKNETQNKEGCRKAKTAEPSGSPQASWTPPSGEQPGDLGQLPGITKAAARVELSMGTGSWGAPGGLRWGGLEPCRGLQLPVDHGLQDEHTGLPGECRFAVSFPFFFTRRNTVS